MQQVSIFVFYGNNIFFVYNAVMSLVKSFFFFVNDTGILFFGRAGLGTKFGPGNHILPGPIVDGGGVLIAIVDGGGGG